MPNRAIEIHDSVLADVSFSQGEARLHFSSVCIHQSEGVPGRDAGSSWVQAAVLRIHHATMEGAFSEFPVDLADGQTRMGGNILDNEIPVPLRHKGAFELCLEAMWQSLQLSRYFGPKLRGRFVPMGEQFTADESEEVRMAKRLLVEPGRKKLNIVFPFEDRFRVFRSFVKCEWSQNEFVVEPDGRFRETSNPREVIRLR
jgi:hypothetical protein